MGGQRVHGHVRRVHAARRPRRRLARAPAGVRRGPAAVRACVAGRRPRPEPGDADRGPRGAGTGRRCDRPRLPLDPDLDVRRGRARNRAVGIWGAMGGAGGSAGVLLGGILTDLLSWRWILFINVPIGLLAALLAQRYIAEGRNAKAPAQLRSGGRGDRHCGPVPARARDRPHRRHRMGLGVDAGADGRRRRCCSWFVAIEGRFAKSPLMPLRIYSSRTLTVLERGHAAARCRRVRNVVLPVALPPAGARLHADPGRPCVPADDVCHRRFLDAGSAAGAPLRRQVPARHRDAVAIRRAAAVHRHLGRRHLRRQRARAVAARGRRHRASPSSR